MKAYKTRGGDKFAYEKIKNNLIYLTKEQCENANSYNYKLKQAFWHLRISNTLSHKKFQRKGFENPCKFAEDDVNKFKLGFVTQPNHILFKLFKDEFQKLFESGITQSIKASLKKQLEKEFLEEFQVFTGERDEVAPLTLFDLKAGFVIWLVAVAVCVLVFIGEILHSQISKLIGKTKSIKIKMLRKKKACSKQIKSKIRKLKKKTKNFALKCNKVKNKKVFYNLKKMLLKKKKIHFKNKKRHNETRGKIFVTN